MDRVTAPQLFLIKLTTSFLSDGDMRQHMTVLHMLAIFKNIDLDFEQYSSISSLVSCADELSCPPESFGLPKTIFNEAPSMIRADCFSFFTFSIAL